MRKLTPVQGFLIKIVFAVALYMVLSIVVAPQADAEVLKSFQSDIKLQSDSSIVVKETFTYDPEFAPPRGIYRVFPLRNQTVSGGSPRCEVKVSSVTDQDGNPIQYSEARLGDTLSLRLGRPKGAPQDVPITYVIQYSAWHTFRFLSGSSEFFWNATGNQWPFTIENAVVNVWFVDGSGNNKPTGVEAFVESPESTRKAAQLMNTSAVTLSAANIPPGESLNLLVSFPDGIVSHESILDKVDLWWSDWWLAVLMPLVCATGLGITYWYSGRDDSPSRSESGGSVAGAGAAARGDFDSLMPPHALSPAEAGTVIDEQCDIEDVMSTVIDLAVRRVLTIKEIDRGNSSNATVHDYEFVRLTSPAGLVLAPHEEKLLDLLFPNGEIQPMFLNELRWRFFSKLKPVNDAIYQNLTTRGFFKGNPKTIRNSFAVLGASLGFFGITLAVVFTQYISVSIGLILCGLITFSAANSMPARTSSGARARESVLAFKRRMQTVSVDEVRLQAEANPEIFEKLLPYALVLGVVDDWIQKCVGVIPHQISWFETATNNDAPTERISDMGRGLRNISTVFTSQDRATTRLREVAEALGRQI